MSIFFKLTTYIPFIIFPLVAQTCTNGSNQYQKYLGTKTPYRLVGNNTFGKLEFTGCNPSKLWMILRHGTRNPSQAFIESMSNRLPSIRDLILKNNPTSTEVLLNSDLIAFQKWENKLDKKDKKKLVQEGENEMVNIAERMQSRFPTLLDNIYSNTSYRFKFTDSQRTRKSAYYFTTGLFGRNTARSVWYPEPLKKDPILRFYKSCTKWRKDVKNNPDSLIHRREFGASPLMVKTVQGIIERLNLPANSLTFEDVYLMYSTCAFETAWKMNVKSPWCSGFSINDMKVMDYYEDLKYYWIDSYGYNLNHEQACVAFDELVSFFNSKNRYPKSTIYFTHSGTLLKVISFFGLYKEDRPLTSKNFNDKVDNRSFRVSKVDPFGTNLALVLFDCEGVSKVLTLHQEHIIRLPCCPTEDLCELDKILKHYRKEESHCDFHDLCENRIDEELEESADSTDA